MRREAKQNTANAALLDESGGGAKAPLQTAVIGAGWIAEKVYLPCLLKHEQIEVVAAWDDSREVLERFSRRAGLPSGALSLKSCFSDAVDSVVLCTPPTVHAAQIARLVGFEKYVLCEKPVFRHVSELETIGPVDAVARHLMGSASMRLREDVSLVLRWVKQGLIGSLERVQLGWWRERGVPAAGSWRTDPELSPLGVLEDLGPHLLDLLASLISDQVWNSLKVTDASLECRYGRDPRRSASWFRSQVASSYYGVPDQARAEFIADTGTRVEVEVCWAHSLPGDYCALVFHGTKGIAELRGLLGFSTLRRSAEQFCRLQRAGHKVEVRRFPAGPEVQLRAFADSIDIFSRFCRGRGRPAADFSEICQVTEWLSDIKQAAGNRLAVHELEPGHEETLISQEK